MDDIDIDRSASLRIDQFGPDAIKHAKKRLMPGPRIIAAACACFFLWHSVSVSQDTLKHGSVPGQLKLIIRPKETDYDLNDARTGNVTIIARVENSSKQSVLFAHPNVCFPHELREGQSLMRDPSQSHLTVLIENPRGKITVLWNNVLRVFEPGNKGHLTIMPGASSEFILSWFGPHYSLGQWNIDQPVFAEAGKYCITVRYRNAYRVAYIFNRQRRPSVRDAWIGELQSNTIALLVK